MRAIGFHYPIPIPMWFFNCLFSVEMRKRGGDIIPFWRLNREDPPFGMVSLPPKKYDEWISAAGAEIIKVRR